MQKSRRFLKVPMIAFFGVELLLKGCGDPKPPPQAKMISPNEMAQTVDAVETVQEQNRAAAYREHMQQLGRQLSAERMMRR